jgi:hypothetical protein
MILTPEDFARGRVTAGVPSLLPEKRAAISNKQRMAFKRDALIGDAEAKKKKAGEGDGNRSRTLKDASGMWLNTDEFFKRLFRLKSNTFYCEPTNGYKDRVTIYRLTNNPENPKVYVGAVHKDKIPEFSIFDKEKHSVKFMGWRTVLLRLITAKIITQAAVETTFGPPRATSKNWHQLFSW